MRRWDPIGVSWAPTARDEYDSYLGRIAESLRRASSVEDIAGLLEGIRCGQMALPANRDADQRVAATLRAWYAKEMSR
jgi:hypothetical protein